MTSQRLISTAVLFVGACLLPNGRAAATTITTSNPTTWKSSSYITGGYSMVDFYPVQQTFYNTAAGITLTPSGSNTAFNVTGLDNGSYYLAGDSSQKALLSSVDAGSFLNIAFPATGENAFLIGSGATAAHPLSLTFSDGESFSITSGAFGVSISHPISWVRLAATPGSQALLSDLWYAASSLPQDAPAGSAPSPTPEPGTVVMTCTGGLLLLWGAKKVKVPGRQLS